MSEVFFYHLTQTPLEVALPKILERALSANWSIEVRANVNTNLEDMSNSIWKGSEESFLPNCLENHQDVQDYPIVLSNSPLKKLRDCLIVVDQAELQENDVESHKRVCLIFDAKNEAQLSNARKSWKSLSESGVNTVYWAESNGKWYRK